MSYERRINEAWFAMLKELQASPMTQKLNSPDLSIDEYRSYLLETFHHTRQNPFSQVLCASHFPRDKHDLFRKFVTHALAEVKHDQLAVEDYIQIGGDPEKFRQRPLSTTEQLIEFTFKKANDSNPIGYLAYLYHVEHLPTQTGHVYVDLLRSKGLPESAMSFLLEHVHVDVIHNKMMSEYIRELVRSDDDCSLFIASFREAAKMHFAMIHGALSRPIPALRKAS